MMIHFYCRICGLYISVPAEYAGGRGVCPRCKTPLRIPRPLPENHPDFIEGLRYLAELFDTTALPPTERPPIVTRAMGPSARFRCEQCEREFESLTVADRPRGQCPNCNTVNETPIVTTVDFPREYASVTRTPVSSGPRESGWIMDGDFLVAPRSADQDPSDSIIQGLPLISDQPGGSILNGAQKYNPEIEAQLATTLAPETSPVAEEDARQWFYLLREHQHGPVSTLKLQQLIQTGKVGLSVLVFHDGLKGWRPVEEFEELRAWAKPGREEEPAPVETRTSPSLSVHEIKHFHQKFVRLLWMFIIAGVIFTLGLVMRQTLLAVGQGFFMRANLLLSILVFLACFYGVYLLIRRWMVFRRAPLSVRLRFWIGLGGLMVCMVTTLTLGLVPTGTGQAQLDRDSILTAQRIFSVLREGNVTESHVSLDWGYLNVNGVEYGARFKAARNHAERQKLMDAVCNVFLSAFEPYFLQEELYFPVNLDSWRVANRSDGYTVVEVRVPSTGRTLRFTLRANRLVGLDRV
ncbi:MAG: DUF4339 domain-containing protein [Phycisphaerae bacterium]|nr:DUF4339 domain-containing protein [Phycisphaerae bacterium]